MDSLYTSPVHGSTTLLRRIHGNATARSASGQEAAVGRRLDVTWAGLTVQRAQGVKAREVARSVTRGAPAPEPPNAALHFGSCQRQSPEATNAPQA